MTTQPSASSPSSDTAKICQVPRTRLPWKPTGQWENPFWASVPPLDIALYMGDKPQHMPRTRARLAYDDQCLYVFFKVEDMYVRAVAQKFHDPVCRDSCVEFFFTPGQDLTTGYFNAEVNCGGTMLCRHQITFGTGTLLAPEDCERFTIHASMPKNVEPEIAAPTTWTVEYRIPYDVLEKYAPVVRPAPGVVWRANLYKCGDHTSHPHWLTWSHIDHPVPKFHLPEFFGTLIFQ